MTMTIATLDSWSKVRRFASSDSSGAVHVTLEHLTMDLNYEAVSVSGFSYVIGSEPSQTAYCAVIPYTNQPIHRQHLN